MSDDTSRVEEPSLHAGSVLDLLEDWYHVPTLAATLLFMFWVRVRSFDNFIVNGRVYFSGNDPWYHLRQVQYTVNNWPEVMPFDAWTGFPYGTSVGQFGTLYDQLIATAALVVGLGSPSEQTVAMTLLVAPAVFGTLVALPTYFIGKRLGGRFTGLIAAGVLALLPGLFLQRGLVGAADHNIAEPVFQATAVLAMMVAVSVAETERPVYEQVAAREFESLRRPFGFSVLAGVATALYLWVWPPGVVLVGIFGVFFVVKLSADYVRGVSPDHLAFVAAVSMTVTGLLSLIPMMEATFSAVAPSLVQPVLAIGVAFGAVFMAWLGRQWERQDQPAMAYPVAVGVTIAVGLLLVRFGIPDLFSTLRANLARLFFFFEQSATAGTVAEAQPFLSRTQQYGVGAVWVVYLEYGLVFFTAIFAALVMLVRAVLTDEHEGQRFLVLVWFAMVASMAFTQVRFNYYLAVPVAVLNGYLVYEVLRFVSEGSIPKRIGDLELYQAFSVVMVLLLLVVPLVSAVPVGGENQVRFSRADQIGNNAGPGHVTHWTSTLDWMEAETPTEGTFAGADNEMAYYGTTERVADYDYPAGSYGVMSWWDYGHWITVQGERIPNANPFQQQATDAANFLLAPNETAAEDVAESLSEDDAKTRYVLVDWKMVAPNSKFGAPTIFYSKADASGPRSFYTPVYQQTQQGTRLRTYLMDQRYYDSLMIRLYRFHGSSVQPNPNVVIDWQPVQFQGNNYYFTPQGNRSLVRSFDTLAAAEEFVAQDGSAQIGGVGRYPSEYVPALQHYRLVQVSEDPAPRQVQMASPLLRNMPTWVKAFERVPGATVEGSGPANATVTAGVRMYVPNRNSTFVYTQQAETGPDGGFRMTLPYSTTGYDEFGPENGYTNVSVRATGPYSFSTQPTRGGEQNLSIVQWAATANVSEAKVVGVDESPVEVTLEEQVLSRPEGANNSTASSNNSTAPPGNSTATGNESAGTGNDSSGALAGTGLPGAGDVHGSPGATEARAAEPVALP